MDIIKLFLEEMDRESVTTRKILACIPDDKYDWKPHEKSMSIEQLSTHIAELPTWVSMAITTSELDFADNPYERKQVANTVQLLELFERSLADGKAQLQKANEKQLLETWTLRNGKDIYSVSPKHEVIRMTFCQIVHHRAQLGVFLRLLNVPIPGSYGPSADDMSF
ncbi:MAG: DinB family protein [Ferruginibacter sp.]